MCVHAHGLKHHALVGLTDKTGNSIVCACAILVPVDPDLCGSDPAFLVTRAHVLEMKRGPNYRVVYLLMESIDNTNAGGTAETIT